MGNSLFDQLQKTGLVDEKKAKQAQKENRKQAKQKRNKKKQTPDESKLRAQQAQAQKAASDRELNKKKMQAAEQNAIAAQIKQLIHMNKIKDKDGDVAFNFADSNKIQRLYITEKLQQQLALGRLTIVKLEQGYELIPSGVAEKIKQRDPSHVIQIETTDPAETDEDDPYAEFKVPDDLMW